jgi:broad specificity phosphatase PhoE
VRLIVVRHGETFNNAEDRFTGQSDVPLSPIGERQALALGAYLASDHLDVIVSSDLQRARITAQAVARYHGLTVEEDPQIRELSLGKWEGMTPGEVQVNESDALMRWRADPSTFAPEGGETLIQFRARIVHALDYWSSLYSDGTVVWVAHGGLIGVLLCHILEINLNRRWQFHHDNASVTELRISGPRVSLVRLNETAFLRQQYQETLLQESL